MNTLKLLELPIGTDALMMHQIDVQQAFGKVPRSTQRFLAVGTIVGVLIELLKNREHPRAIVEEDLLLHNEHIAEACLVALEESIGILFVIRIHLA